VPDQLRVRVGSKVETVALDEYVLGAALSEVIPVGEPDAAVATIYQVQSIVARTYAVHQAGRHRSEGFDLCDTTHCQIYQPDRIRTSRFAAAARAAVAQTSGRVLAYGVRVAETVFHADCGGQTAANNLVWGGPPVAYLKTIADNLAPDAHRAWEVTATIDQLRKALNVDPRTEVGRRLDSIDVVTRDESGRAGSIGLRGEHSVLVRGDSFRTVVNAALSDHGLMSTRFTATRNGNRYIFSGTGFGHGVGLCQRGAIGRARRGDTTEEILQTYYPGTIQTAPR
jgi:stage II sporulation protein D